jgi:hypothetical protein
MRILISIGCGFAVAVLMIVQFVGIWEWCPSSIFRSIHAPAAAVAGLFAKGEAGWSVIPFTIAAQWLLVGAVVGLVLHLKCASKP